VLWEAVTAVHWPALCRFKRYFTFGSTVGTDCFGHLTRTVKAFWGAEITPASIFSSFHRSTHAVWSLQIIIDATDIKYYYVSSTIPYHSCMTSLLLYKALCGLSDLPYSLLKLRSDLSCLRLDVIATLL